MPQAGNPSGTDRLSQFDSAGMVATSMVLMADSVRPDELFLLLDAHFIAAHGQHRGVHDPLFGVVRRDDDGLVHDAQRPGSWIDSGSAGRGCTPFPAGIRAFSCAYPSGATIVALPQVSIRRAKYDLFASGRIGLLRSVALRASPVTEQIQQARFPVFAVPFSHLEISCTQFATKDRASFDGKF